MRLCSMFVVLPCKIPPNEPKKILVLSVLEKRPLFQAAVNDMNYQGSRLPGSGSSFGSSRLSFHSSVSGKLTCYYLGHHQRQRHQPCWALVSEAAAFISFSCFLVVSM